MIRGLIVSSTDGLHVYIPEIHPFGLSPTQYPVAPFRNIYQLEARTGVYQTVRSQQWCWIEFEKDDPHRPVIVGFISEQIDLSTESEKQLFSIVSNNHGFRWNQTKDGTEMICDGDVQLRIGSDTYTSLYKQLNDLKAKLDEHDQQLSTLNTHVHSTPGDPVTPMTGPMLVPTVYIPKMFEHVKRFVPL